jgi:hypothetical protein
LKLDIFNYLYEKCLFSMKSIYKIIKEEYVKFIKEVYDDDVESIYFERENNIKTELFQDFLYQNTPDFSKHVPWQLISFPRLKKIWEDYMRTGVVRDTRGLETIEDIMTDNTMKVNAFTALGGHTQWGDEETFENNIGYFVDQQLNCILSPKNIDTNQLEIPFNNPKKGFVKKKPVAAPKPCNTQIHPYIQEIFDENYEEGMKREEIRKILYEHMKNRFYDYYQDDPENKMGGFISDYGLNALVTLNGQLMRATKPEDKVVIIDKMLNVLHQRSDIAEWFVEGDSGALNQLSGYRDSEEDSTVSGSYQMSDYY